MNQLRDETDNSPRRNHSLRHREKQVCCAGDTAARMRFACNAARRQMQLMRAGGNS
jgi:hypothetical protein